MCCEEAFPVPGLWGDKDLILVGALFPLDGRGEGKNKKTFLWGRSISPGLDYGCAAGCSC
jgi:hypothetical protein